MHTGRLALRGPVAADFEPVAAFLASDRAAHIGGRRSRADAWRTFAVLVGHWELRGYGMWSVEARATGPLVGMVGLYYPEDWLAPEVGWWIVDAGAEGKGYAREAALAARRYASTSSAGRGLSASSRRKTPARSASPNGSAATLDRTRRPRRTAAGPRSTATRPGGPAMTRSDAIRRAADLLRGHRESIDRLDAILVFTLAERFKHTQAVGVLKAQHGLPPSDPARESVQIARLERLAEEADLDPAFARKFLNFIISEVISHHERHLENGPQPAHQPKETETDGHEDPARPRRVQEASALLDRRRRLALAARRPLHREARHLRPLLPKDNEGRVKIDLERVQYWLGQGAQTTDRVAALPRGRRRRREEGARNPKQGEPGKAAQERAKARADKAAAARDRRDRAAE